MIEKRKNQKKAIDTDGFSIKERAAQNKLSESSRTENLGVAGDRIIEPTPGFIKTPSERVLGGHNDAYIVLGRDRPGDRMSGYGGKGDTQASCIDIVVGRYSVDGTRAYDENNERTMVDPSFEKDAARIYISQKADVDDYFGLSGVNSKTKSTIAIKSDSTRIMSRERVKIVAGLDSKNSQGGSSRANYGIDLIANNDITDLQPLVKGKNLKDALLTLITQIDNLNGIVESLMRHQMTLNSALIGHIHTGVTTGPGISGPSVEVIAAGVPAVTGMAGETYPSLVNNKLNASIFKFNYCIPTSRRYILSRNNNTN